ncbi:MAG TPA: tRNA (guanosine(37)-N1)-methyltransferase TrmD [Blastocatellia bacterium]|jgi:tRNA (guanine37-N1)-methyltransferase
MRFDIITIFPEIFREVFDFGIIRRARESGIIEIGVHDLRDFTFDRHHQTDDRPFGGGAGMVMKPEPLFRAVEFIAHDASEQKTVALLSPQGRLFDQRMAERLSSLDQIILICGRYEGVDERVVEHLVTEEISIGDFVLSGGEIAAMVIVDAVTRLLPGALGCEESAERESFSEGLLDHPHYTRPVEYRGMKVPDVLTSGNHARIEEWRRQKAVEKTLRCRPDLIAKLGEAERREAEKISRDIQKEDIK